MKAEAQGDYVFVPLEPTDEMIAAALAATSMHLDIVGSQLAVNREKMRVRYRAMVAAVAIADGLAMVQAARDGRGVIATISSLRNTVADLYTERDTIAAERDSLISKLERAEGVLANLVKRHGPYILKLPGETGVSDIAEAKAALKGNGE